MQHGTYHPITQCKLTGAFDADNNLTALQIRLSGQSIQFSLRPAALVNGMDPGSFSGLNATGEAAIGYSVPNLLIQHAMRNPHVPPGLFGLIDQNASESWLDTCEWSARSYGTCVAPLPMTICQPADSIEIRKDAGQLI